MSVRNPAAALALAAATLAATNAIAGDTEVIVESGADGYNAADFQKPSGKWSDSVAKSTAPGLRAGKSAFAAIDTTADAARFAPKLPAAGKYRVSVTYPKSGNAAGVVYRVVSKGGTKEIIQDQEGISTTSTANSWIDLGVFDFDAGKAGYVEVCDPATGRKATDKEPNARVYADAVKFVPEGMSLPADYANVIAVAPTSDLAAATAGAGSALPNLAAAVSGSGAPAPATSAANSGLPSLSAALSSPAAAPAIASAPVSSVPSQVSAVPELPPLAALPPADAGMPALAAPAPATLPSLSAAAAPAATAAPTPLPAIPAGTLPSLASAAAMPEPSTSPAPGSLPSLSAVASVTPSAPSMPPLSTASATQSAETSLPPLTGPVSAPDPAPPAPAATPAKPGPEDGSITWDYDYSLALGAARASGRNVLVFVTAPRNKTGAAYEAKFFKDPAVRAVMDKFVLVKVDFTRNSESAYGLRVYKPGAIAVTDAGGDRIGEPILSIPATPEDLAKQLEAFVGPAVKK